MEEKVKEIAECCICIELFTDPRMLHSHILSEMSKQNIRQSSVETWRLHAVSALQNKFHHTK